LPGLLDHVLRPGSVLVVFPCDRTDLVVGEVVRELAHVLLLVRKSEVDHWCSLSQRGADGARLIRQSILVLRVPAGAPEDAQISRKALEKRHRSRLRSQRS